MNKPDGAAPHLTQRREKGELLNRLVAYCSPEALIILLVASAMMLPALLAPPMLHQSFWIDVVWTDQFTKQLQAGILYPRWLPESHGGLGSPVFYYYPPLAFYLSGAFGLLGMPPYSAVLAAFWAALVGSGLAMRHWLRNAPNPIVGAVVYMVAPYHLYDFYVRGALAEFCAFAVLPLVALGVRTASSGRPALLAFSYGALIMTHLPMAVLAGPFLIAPYGLWICRHELRRLVPLAFAVSLGIALSAIYLLPALALDSYRDTAKLWTLPSLNPEAWSILKPEQWVKGTDALKIMVMTAAIALSALIVAVWKRRFWAVLGVVLALLSAGIIPSLWAIPLLKAVQFPWRMLAIVEFATITALAYLPLAALVIAASPMLLLPAAVVSPISKHRHLATILAEHPDVPEYLPKGAPPWTNWHSEWALQHAKAHPGRVFYFPSWRGDCRPAKEPETLLLAPCPNRRIVWTLPEILGAILSLVALLLVIKRSPPKTDDEAA